MLTSADIAADLGCSTRHAADLVLDMEPIDISRPGSRRPLWRVPEEHYIQWKAKRGAAAAAVTGSGNGARFSGAASGAKGGLRDARIARRRASRVPASNESPQIRLTQPLKPRRSAT